MRIELQKRAGASNTFALLSPLIALALMMIAGALMFIILGKNPLTGLYVYFIEPLTDPWSREQILVKATPLTLIAIGLAVCFRSGNWNIGAEGQYLIGGLFGAALPVLFHQWGIANLAAADAFDGHGRWCALWLHSSDPEVAVWNQRDSDQSDAGLCCPTICRLGGSWTLA